MARAGSEHPTELELEILQILWKESPLPVREVRTRLASDADRALAHSSVITMLNIMHRKGFVHRRKEGNAFVFGPIVKQESVTGGMLSDLLSRLFKGSPSAMVLNLLETADVDRDELDQIRKLVTRKAREQKP